MPCCTIVIVDKVSGSLQLYNTMHGVQDIGSIEGSISSWWKSNLLKLNNTLNCVLCTLLKEGSA